VTGQGYPRAGGWLERWMECNRAWADRRPVAYTAAVLGGFLAVTIAFAAVSFAHLSAGGRWAVVDAAVAGALVSVGWQLQRRAKGGLFSTQRPTTGASAKRVAVWIPICTVFGVVVSHSGRLALGIAMAAFAGFFTALLPAGMHFAQRRAQAERAHDPAS
jgi:hypothetical protein